MPDKDNLILFFVAYLVIVSIILSFLVSAIHSTYVLNLLNLPVQTSFSLGSILGMFNLFASILLFIVPDALIPIYIQIPFTIFPKFAIGFILLTYIKDML